MKRRAMLLGVLVWPAIAYAQRMGPTEHYLVDVGGAVTRSAEGVANYSLGENTASQLRMSPDGTHLVFRGMRVGTDVYLLTMSDGSQVRCEVTVRDPSN